MAPSHRQGGDRLSALPDNALERVLSDLASGEAVRSSVLSRRWRRVHEGVPVIDLVDTKTGKRYGIGNLRVCFDHTVTSAIVSKAAETPIRTFRLDAFHPPHHMLNQWIATVTTSGVEELDIKLRYIESSNHTLCPFGLTCDASADFHKSDRKRYTTTHRQIFGCPTLRRLRLTNWMLDLPGSVNMALLDTLCLARIMDPYAKLQKLISGCPSLVHLTLEECPSIKEIAVTSTRLRSFAMICCHNASSVELHSTCVQSLHYKGGLPPRKLPFFALTNYEGVKAASIEICEKLSDKGPRDVAAVTRLISQCTKLAYLHISLRPSMAYYSSIFASVLHGLDSLRHLSLQGCLPTDHAVRSVAALLINTKHLEVLSLFPLGPEPPKEKRTGYMGHDNAETDSDNEPEDGTVDNVVEYSSRMPESIWRTYVRCLEYNLRRINIGNYQGRPLEKMLARFLLSRAAALEEFSVTLAEDYKVAEDDEVVEAYEVAEDYEVAADYEVAEDYEVAADYEVADDEVAADYEVADDEVAEYDEVAADYEVAEYDEVAADYEVADDEVAEYDEVAADYEVAEDEVAEDEVAADYEAAKELTSWRWNRHTRVTCN